MPRSTVLELRISMTNIFSFGLHYIYVLILAVDFVDHLHLVTVFYHLDQAKKKKEYNLRP